MFAALIPLFTGALSNITKFIFSKAGAITIGILLVLGTFFYQHLHYTSIINDDNKTISNQTAQISVLTKSLNDEKLDVKALSSSATELQNKINSLQSQLDVINQTSIKTITIIKQVPEPTTCEQIKPYLLNNIGNLKW